MFQVFHPRFKEICWYAKKGKHHINSYCLNTAQATHPGKVVQNYIHRHPTRRSSSCVSPYIKSVSKQVILRGCLNVTCRLPSFQTTYVQHVAFWVRFWSVSIMKLKFLASRLFTVVVSLVIITMSEPRKASCPHSFAFSLKMNLSRAFVKGKSTGVSRKYLISKSKVN